ncbi:conserved protein of unknown function [Tenacibaculum sp. 190524A02b]|uniref:hypothetical protein n=1 Tax=Tenacibaculum vairaonense TaxID=3137860 RepID=UPI0032B1E841
MKKLIYLTFFIYTLTAKSQGGKLTLASQSPKAEIQRPMFFNPQMIGGSLQNTNVRTYNKMDVFKGVKGSFYLYDHWNNTSTIISHSDKRYIIKNLNFDLDEEKFLSKISNDSVYIYQNLKKVIIGKKSFIDINDKFYEEVCHGKINLLKNYSGKLKKAVINKMTNQQVKPAEYIKVTKLYIYKDDIQSLKKIKLKKSSINNLFSDKKELILSYIQKNKLSYGKESDFLKMIDYFNSLFPMDSE